MLCFTCFAHAQQYVDVVNQTITVNSKSNLTGRDRQYIRADFPANTTGFIYRATITTKGASSNSPNLLSLLSQYAPGNIAMGAQLTQFIVNNNDGSLVDAFTFYNPYDADNFFNNKDGYWGACNSSLGLVNTCYASNNCLNPRLYFGFRNNNLMEGLNVHLEIVAIVDTARTVPFYTYSITNATNQELKFQMSNNQESWSPVTLRNGYVQTFTQDQPLYFKISTTSFNFVRYKLDPNERYKIIWSIQNKWDLIRY
jgi:hypothetical protein